MTQASAVPRIDRRSTAASIRLPRTLSWLVPVQMVALVVLTAALFAEPFVRLVEMRESNVYAHIAFAQRIAETHVLYPGHFLYHILTVATHGVLPVSWLQANVIALVAMRALLALIVWVLLWRALGGRNSATDALLATVLTLALLFASAVTFLTWGQGNYYLGYIVPNIYISQTMVVLQPLALLTFFAVIRVIDTPRPGPSWRDVLAMAVLTVLSTLAKPSYAMVLLPALAILLFLRRELLNVILIRRVGFLVLLGRWFKDLKSIAILGLGLVVPGLAAIGWVYLSTYLTHQRLDVSEGSGIRLAPFKVVAHLQSAYVSPDNVALWLALKLVLSLVFPMAVAIVYFRQVRHDTRVQLAWLQLIFGLIFMYLFAEHPRFASGNFVWSAQIALFILFIVSTLVLVEQTLADDPHRWRRMRANPAAILCYAALLLHVVAGCGMSAHPAVS